MAGKLRVGIVGCGGISRAHVAAYQDANATVASVYDVVPEAARAMADETGAGVAPSLDRMAEDDRLDAVSICSPPAAHYANAKPFLKRGIAILCEKPLELNPPTAARFARAVDRSKSVFMTAFCHRFHPPVVELRKLIRRGTLGQARLYRNIFGGYSNLAGNHRVNPALSGGGCLLDHGCHSMDLFRFLVGDPVEVQAVTANIAQDLPVEDFGMVHLRTRDGAFGEITATYSLKVCGNWVEWYGTKGTAIISYWNPGHPDLAYKVAGGEWKNVDLSTRPTRFMAEVRHFLRCVRAKCQPDVTVADGLAASRIASAVYRSAATARRVSLRL